MKQNLPVTRTERFLERGKPIVTKTDTDGRITYANESFVAISGFTREELIGSNHHVVRHPDMPPAAFADLWRTIRAGYPWRGLVKNRSKEGDFYWVEAFVTPMTENGVIRGFMSVRTVPSRADVERAEAFYRDVRAGTATFPATRFPRPLAHLTRTTWAAAGACAAASLVAPWLGGTVGIVGGAVAALGTVGFAGWIATSLVRPLHRLERTLAELDEGQLARSVEADGSSLESLFVRAEAMRIHLRATFCDLLVGARMVAAQTQDLRSEVGRMHENSERQRERVMQIAAAMEQMSVSVSEIANSTNTGMKAASDTEAAARESVETMRSGVSSSRRVTEVVEASRGKIAEVDTYITKIGQFASLIKDIAEQTNLLALNAAIEAARAGEQGRGFAVVADEVRKLAERTAQSTREISTAVADIMSRSHDAVSTMSIATSAVTEATNRIVDAEGSMARIVEHSQTAVEVARSIDDMLKQQSSASQDVAVGMEVISSTADQNSAAMDGVGEVAARLAKTSDELHALVVHLEQALG